MQQGWKKQQDTGRQASAATTERFATKNSGALVRNLWQYVKRNPSDRQTVKDRQTLLQINSNVVTSNAL